MPKDVDPRAAEIAAAPASSAPTCPSGRPCWRRMCGLREPKPNAVAECLRDRMGYMMEGRYGR